MAATRLAHDEELPEATQKTAIVRHNQKGIWPTLDLTNKPANPTLIEIVGGLVEEQET